MMKFYTKILIITIIYFTTSQAKILRNNALMTKMVSNFRQENEFSNENDESRTVMFRMQNVLCKNFPTIPCKMIVQDKTLQKLIEKSIQQINYKKFTFEKTTPFPGYLTLFPLVKEVEQRQDTFKANKKKDKHEKKKIKTKKRTSVYNRKKLRKFYPHKVKYRDKAQNIKDDYGDNSADKLSMSVEIPDMTLTRKHQHFAYKMIPVDPPVWRIDYMKHGEPSVNMFGQGSNGVIKTGPNVVVDGMDTRKDVLHPDLYIKKNYIRKNIDLHSDGD